MELRSLCNNGNEDRALKRKRRRIKEVYASYNVNFSRRRIKEIEVEAMELRRRHTANMSYDNGEQEESTSMQKRKITKAKLTDTERKRKHREKMRQDKHFDIKKYHENERMRVAKYRKVQKEKMNRDKILLFQYRKKERLRKRKQRRINKEYEMIKIINPHESLNIHCRSTKEKENIINDLQFNVKKSRNVNRSLKCKSESISSVSLLAEEISEHSINFSVPSTSQLSNILGSVSPSSFKRVMEYEEKPKKDIKNSFPRAGNTMTSKEMPLNSNTVNHKIIRQRGKSSSNKNNESESEDEIIDNHTNAKKLKKVPDSLMLSPARKSGREAKPTEKLKKYLHEYEMPIKLNHKSSINGENQISKDTFLKPDTTFHAVNRKRGRTCISGSDGEDNGNDIKSMKYKEGKENILKKMTVQYPCGACGSEVRNSSVWCTGCLKWCHKRCSGLKSLVKVAGNFKCPTCLGGNIKKTTVMIPEKDKKKKTKPDCNAIVVPKGWRRKEVKRTSFVRNGKFDVYYYSPQGKKLRSRKEIEKYCQEQGIEVNISLFSFNYCERSRLSLKSAGLPIIPRETITSMTSKDVELIKETRGRGRPKGSTKSKKEKTDDMKIYQSPSKLVEPEWFKNKDINPSPRSSPSQKDKIEALKEFRGRTKGSTKFEREVGVSTININQSPVRLAQPEVIMNGGNSPRSSPGLRKLRLVDNQNKSKHAAITNSGIEDEDHEKIKNNLNVGEKVFPTVMPTPITKSGRQVKLTEKLKESTIPINSAGNISEPGAVTYASMTKLGTANRQAKHPHSVFKTKGFKQVVRDLSKTNEESPNWDLSLARMTEVYSWVNTAPEEMKKKVNELTLRFFSCIEILQSKHRTSLPTQELINV